MENYIYVKGARQHNLKNIDVKIPRNQLVIITGVSGSGKSSLAMDTIYAEGQRRYLESLSTYARQFLGELNKPDVDFIEGLSPAIAIEQKTVSKNPRSTVGTVTEIHDYLRLLYAHIGKPHCPSCGRPIKPQTSQEIISTIMNYPEHTKIIVTAPIARQRKGTFADTFKKIRNDGYVRVKVDGEVRSLDEKIILEKNIKHDIQVIVDRLVIKRGIKKRLSDAVENALRISDGLVFIEMNAGSAGGVGDDDGAAGDRTRVEQFSDKFACVHCGVSYLEITPRMFSFNNPVGACPTCKGLGYYQAFNPDLLITNVNKPLYGSGMEKVPGYGNVNSYSWRMIKELFNYFKQDFNAPVNELDKEFVEVLMLGSGTKKFEFNFSMGNSDKDFEYTGKLKRAWEGIFNTVNRRYHETSSTSAREWYSRFMSEQPCPTCDGKRLRRESLSVLVGGKNIHEFTILSIKDAKKFITKLENKLSPKEKKISKEIIKEIKGRLTFLVNVNLDYLSLDRMAGTLSGGESQRIRLASQIGSSLVGVLYVLDEPSIGLHAKDKMQLIKMLKKLKGLGNTVIVIEHDEDFIRHSDHVIDIGPGPGIHGGEVVAQGTLDDIVASSKSLTGKYLSGKSFIAIPLERRELTGEYIEVKGAKQNNLKNIDVKFPLGVFTVVTGVSGAGKSSLVNDILYKGLSRSINHSGKVPGKHESITGIGQIDKIINIDQNPIGRTPRSNVVTYTKVFDDIRDIFAATKEAKARGYKKGRFSFNVKGGRCENCNGSGFLEIEMHFLPNVYVTCDVCRGRRYNVETLEITYKDHNIDDVLRKTVEEALEFFRNHPKIRRKLKTLVDVGLGYMELGQIAPTMSGGEAQRMKLAKELGKPSTGKTLYILDEPTTGLHFDDVKKLLAVLNRLVDKGNTVIVIEHNLDVIKCADHIIDLGPQGGDEGGYLIVEGTPEGVASTKGSFTGQFLKDALGVK
ncbi:MAG: excinuclease ABC subunit UvrA [Promethearchaeota archaeon]